MKEGWEIVKIKDVCNKASSNVAQKSLDHNNGDYPIFGASGFIKNVDFFHFDKPYIGIVKDGSGIGRVNIYPAYSSLLGTLQYILPNDNCNLSFLAYALKSLDLSSHKAGAAIPHIYFRDYGEEEICFPPLAEQERIVSILDKAFEKIDAIKANAEENLANAKALFQAALKKELTPKEGWEEKKVKDFADIKGGKRVPKGYKLELTKTNHPYIRVSDFSNEGTVNLNDIKYISDEVFDTIKRYTIDSTNVYISIAGTIGKSGIIPKELDGANLTENACKLVLVEGIYNKFVYYTIISDSFQEQIKQLTMQAAQPKLALTRLATITCYIPSYKEQCNIASILDSLSSKCKEIEQNCQAVIAECDALKQAILRKAFNGEL